MSLEVNMDGKRLELKRYFDAPRARVFDWFTSGEKLQQWSSCKDATECCVTMDFRVGGAFTHTMVIPCAGGEFTATGQYEEIVVPEKIVYTSNLGFCTVTISIQFFDEGAGTRLIMVYDGLPEEGFGTPISQGTGESFDKLDVVLSE
jgi:uncharacterized protein YndB with AHSA1/START domain